MLHTFKELLIMLKTVGNTSTRAGDQTVLDGNIVIGTANKGIDFSATSHAAGMTSELLADYEEGSWTPNQGGGVTVTGTFSSSGTYTKIGRQVTVRGQMSGSTDITVTGGDFFTTNLPFASANTTVGAVGTGAATVAGTCISNGSILFASAVATTASTVFFTITYFV